ERLGAAILDLGAAGAAHTAKGAMNLQYAAAAGRLVQTIHVLCDQREAVGAEAFLERDEGMVSRIRLHLAQIRAAQVVEAPNQTRVMGKGTRRGHILDTVPFP